MHSLPSPRSLATRGLAAAAVLATLSLPQAAGAAAPVDADDATDASRFTLAVLPDTQFYSRYAADQFIPRYGKDPFQVQTEWIAEHADELNIPFVTHVGDIVDRAGNAGEWTAADRAMDVLDAAGVPYGILAGNHDVNNSSDSVLDTDYTVANERYWQNFGPGKRPAPTTLGGYDATGFSQWHVFEAQGQKFLSMSLPWRASDATLAWAKQVIETQNLPTILTSHDLIGIDADAVTARESGYGKRVWDGLIKSTDQIFLTFNGHFHGSTHLTRNNDAGHPVTQVLIDHQMAYEGGNGYLGLMEFDLTNNTMTMQTASPWVVGKPAEKLTSYDQAFLEAPNQQYQVKLDFSARFAGFQDGPADQPSLTKKARDIILDGFVPPAGDSRELAGNEDDYVRVPGTLAHWRFGDAQPGVVAPGQVFEDAAGESDLRRATLAESGSTTAEVGDVTVTDQVNPYSSDPRAVCFDGSNQTTGRFSYLQSAAGTPVTKTKFPNGYTIETFVKMDASWDATANGWSKAVVRSGNRSTIPGFARTQWDYTASPTALGISNLREFQMTEVPGDPTRGDKTAWSGEIMVDTWQHVAVVNDVDTQTTTMYVDGAPVLRNATASGGASMNSGMPWILGADWVDDKAKNGWHGCIGETRIIDHPTTPDQWLIARPELAGFTVDREPAATLPTGTASTVLTGTGTPRATVTLGGDLDGSATVDADGRWWIAADVPATGRPLTWTAEQGFGERVDDTVATGTFAVAAPALPASSTAATLATDAPSYGAPHRVVVRVAGAAAPTGAVRVSAGGRVLGTGTLAGGRAVVTLPGTALAPGRHELVVDYPGDAGHAPSYDRVTVRVARAAADLRVRTAGTARRPRLVVRLDADVAARGRIEVRSGNRVVARTTATDGRRVVRLPRLTRGRHVLTVRYAGSATVAPATERVVVRVRR
ncbi:Ig-like domain repeat protein [Nocardioides lianchengensis]|uniref:Calcineurin-like phosphoesterase n=1 Tax=Nocardioides lianchengensis TaxID=1045774 RepID=A0A1G6KYJ2_9ACTN|nr:Ig-like domain repeat protein [Nocardioides lianchengensis]NYG13750.1 hypothetical protein [Nocardioides lianchengensis]SDC36179.1 Calcineurin-like phosphoesterase [Nocardioides lianchengensis]